MNEVPVCPGDSITKAYNKQRARMEADCHCDFAISLAVPKFSTEVAKEMEALADEKKVATFAFRFCSPAHSSEGLDDYVLSEALQTCANAGILPSVVACGNPAVITKIAEDLNATGPTAPEDCLRAAPERFEADTVARVGLLAADISCPVLFNRVHSPAALKALAEQRRNGIAFGETSIAAIGAVLGGSTVTHPDWSVAASCVAEPPIRPEGKVARRLLKYVATGELLAVGSAHRAIATSVRAGIGATDFRRIPVGQATAACRLSALWKCGVESEALLDPCAFVAAISANPARLFNLYPRKGRIAEGSDADLVIWNPNSSAEPMKTLPNDVEDPFKGLNLCSCQPEVVVLRGKVVVKNGIRLEASSPKGEFLPVEAFGDFAFGRMKALRTVAEGAMVPVKREAYDGPVINLNNVRSNGTPPREGHYYRKSDYDNQPKGRFLNLSHLFDGC